MVYRVKKNIIDELKCIWMSTNFVEEKLCNNNFDCDNCTFDREMRNSKHQRELCESIYHFTEMNLIEEIIAKLNKLKSFSFPPKYFFSKCFVLKNFLGDTYCMGFNPMLDILLDNINESNLSRPSQVFKKGEDFINIKGDWGNVNISAPFDFRLESELLPISLKPKNGKWLGFIKSTNGSLELENTGREGFIKTIDSVCGNLRRHIKKYVTVGVTMYDGGEKLKYIYQIIGKENYIKILIQVLS